MVSRERYQFHHEVRCVLGPLRHSVSSSVLLSCLSNPCIFLALSTNGHPALLAWAGQVVVSLGEDPKHRGLVRPLVEQLERRMRLLVERDYRSAVASLEGVIGPLELSVCFFCLNNI